MTELFVVAFDPGGTTGWCVMGVESDDFTDKKIVKGKDLADCLSTFDYGQIDCSTILDEEEASKIIYKHNGMTSDAENRGVDVMRSVVIDNVNYISLTLGVKINTCVVLEDFILDPDGATKGRELLSPVRIISAFSYAMRNENISGFIQNRSPVKTTCTDERLRNWDINPIGGHNNRHARDATRHAFFFLRNCFGNNLKAATWRWRAWPTIFSDPLPESLKRITKEKKGKRIESLG